MEYNRKVDSYNVSEVTAEGTNPSERLKDIDITYYCDGEFFASSPTYHRVSEDKISKIKEKLFDYTLYNLNEECISRTIPFFTMVNAVETIIFDK